MNTRIEALSSADLSIPVAGNETMFGIAPAYVDIRWGSLDFTPAQFDTVSTIDPSAWVDELRLHDEHFARLEQHPPRALADARVKLGQRLKAAAEAARRRRQGSREKP
jgi:phosphoenolpyruvate carboxykinase (GTP)